MRSREITLKATKAVVVDGVNLPAGNYPGTEKRLSIPGPRGQTVYLDPEYKLHMSAELAQSIPGWENFLGAELNATPNVLDGSLVVS